MHNPAPSLPSPARPVPAVSAGTFFLRKKSRSDCGDPHATPTAVVTGLVALCEHGCPAGVGTFPDMPQHCSKTHGSQPPSEVIAVSCRWYGRTYPKCAVPEWASVVQRGLRREGACVHVRLVVAPAPDRPVAQRVLHLQPPSSSSSSSIMQRREAKNKGAEQEGRQNRREAIKKGAEQAGRRT